MELCPLSIYTETTANVLMTTLMTYLIWGRSENLLVPLVWAGGVTFANPAPVIRLRLHMDQSTSYAKIWELGFSAD